MSIAILDADALPGHTTNATNRAVVPDRMATREAGETVLLCWRCGQRSPIHDHAGSICGIRIVEGTATETLYARSPCGYLYPTGSRRLEAGSVTVSREADVHQMTNLARAGNDPIALHVDSPPLSGTRTYPIGVTTLADHDRLAALRPGVLSGRVRVDGAHSCSSNTPGRASQAGHRWSSSRCRGRGRR